MRQDFTALTNLPPVAAAAAAYSPPVILGSGGPPVSLVFSAPRPQMPRVPQHTLRRRQADFDTGMVSTDPTCFSRMKNADGVLSDWKEVPCATTTATPAVARPVKMCQVEERYPPGWHGNAFSETIIVTKPCEQKKSWCW